MAESAQLVPPPGYGRITPLDRNRHAGMGIKPDQRYAWCASMNAVFVNAVEFFKAGLDYPIAFTREPRSGEFMPLAVLGLRDKQNLFADAEGKWRPNTYIPAYFRRFPFCIVQMPPKDGQPQNLVCVQEDQLLEDAPQPLFDAAGEPAPAWPPMLQMLEAIEGARQQTQALCKHLESLQLLVPFDAVATSTRGDRMRLQGLFRVDEEKLSALAPKDLQAMFKNGELRAIYAHLLSLENFARLLDFAASAPNTAPNTAPKDGN